MDDDPFNRFHRNLTEWLEGLDVPAPFDGERDFMDVLKEIGPPASVLADPAPPAELPPFSGRPSTGLRWVDPCAARARLDGPEP